jgi:hypothetical protein
VGDSGNGQEIRYIEIAQDAEEEFLWESKKVEAPLLCAGLVQLHAVVAC